MTPPRMLLVLLTSCVACLPGPEDLIEQSDIHVSVTGATPAQRVTLAIAEQSWTQAGDIAPVDFYVPADERGELALTAEGGSSAPRCLRVSYDLSLQRSYHFDVSSLAMCNVTPLRQFESAFLERVKEASCETDCLERTAVNARGQVHVVSKDEEATYTATTESLEELIAAVLSQDADTLFAGECEGSLLGNDRRIGRTLRIAGGVVDTFRDEETEFRSCQSGVHGLINSAFSGLKEAE